MGRFLVDEVPRVVLRLALVLAIYGIAGAIPWPAEMGHWVSVVASGAVAAAVLILCGKLLFDTLFYERYWRQVDSR